VTNIVCPHFLPVTFTEMAKTLLLLKQVPISGLSAKSLASLAILFVLILSSLARSTNSAAQAPAPPQVKWEAPTTAAKLAAQQGKPLLIEVYTNWCGWCKRMEEETFADPAVVRYVGANFVAMRIDAESDKKVLFDGREISCRELARSVLRINNYPSVVYVANGQVSVIPGYQKPADLQKFLNNFMAKAQ
jgi:thioredoxin-related protein